VWVAGGLGLCGGVDGRWRVGGVEAGGAGSGGGMKNFFWVV